ncbi:MAG: hypothetical protein AAFN93_15005 [Bacteroidota bacterium]
MVVISVRTEEGFKKLVKSQAALSGVSLQQYVIDALRKKLNTDKKEFTTEDFNKETLDAFKEAEEGSLTECENLVELHKALGI